MKNVKEMTYKELEKETIENSHKLLTTKNLKLKRALCIRGHELMTEMDRRWNASEMKTKVIK